MTAPPRTPARYRAAFGVAEFRVLFTLFTLQVTGDSARAVALSVLTFERTGSALAAALVFAASMLPYVVGGMFLLSLADRVPARVLLTGQHFLRFAVTAVLATGATPLPVTIALLTLTGLFAPVGSAAVQARLPRLLPGDAYVLGRSLFMMAAAGAQIVGQAAGGLLLPVLGAAGTLWLCTAGAALAVVVALRLPGGGGEPSQPSRGTARETWRVNGVLLRDPVTRGLLLAGWLPISLSAGAEGVVVPYAADLGRPGAAGQLLAAGAAGMFAGNFVVGRWVPAPLRDRLTLPLALLTGAPLLLFALAPGLVLACVVLACATAGLSYELTVQHRLVEAAPEAVRGQALGLAGTGVMTGQAAAISAAGALGEIVSPPRLMALCGAAAVAVCLGLTRSLHRPS
ncbi:MFS transporter [Actinomadura roseirufa]|uniref:MFS transporter n=1 Tax=Actinomadura roseirufa TaxID=2094049 RepID=UPI0010414B1B|nr:MFS transporter [Actinomadura roseirufa]